MKAKWLVCAKIVIYVSALFLLLFLSINSFLYSSDGYELHRSGGWRFVQDLLGCVLFLGFCFLLIYIGEKISTKICALWMMLLFLSVMIFCAWWIANSVNLPQSDAKSVYDIAYRAKNHDLLPVAPTGSYMSLWPFQSGLVLFFEMILRLIPNAGEMTIQWFYLPFMALSLISGYMVVKKSFSSVRTSLLWCILMSLCFPYFFHINNMYGEIPSIALSLFTLWMLLEYSAKPSWLKLLSAGLGLAAAVAIRKNTLIFVIACVLVWLVVFVKEKRIHILLLLSVLISAAVSGIILPQKFYEYRARNIMGKGVPAVAYIAMGLQWDEGRSPGGWNGYHSDLFIDCSFDSELTSQISAVEVQELLKYMAENPGYMGSFFYHKQIEQWEREDFLCFYETLEFYGSRTPAAWAIYQGEAKDKFLSVMSVHQSLVYMGGTCFCILAAVDWRKKKSCGNSGSGAESLEKLVLLVTFIGGFLFSIMWEACPRYNLPYFIMLIPYAADGFADISRYLDAYIGSRKHNNIAGNHSGAGRGGENHLW